LCIIFLCLGYNRHIQCFGSRGRRKTKNISFYFKNLQTTNNGILIWHVFLLKTQQWYFFLFTQQIQFTQLLLGTNNFQSIFVDSVNSNTRLENRYFFEISVYLFLYLPNNNLGTGKTAEQRDQTILIMSGPLLKCHFFSDEAPSAI
jgi:hypothetical protein